MSEKKNWRYRFVIGFYDFWGIDVTRMISNEKRFQRTADLIIVSIVLAILGTIFPIILGLLSY